MVIQSPQNGKWLEKGVIEKKRVAADGSSQSFEIKMEDGSVKLRNKRFIRHAVKGAWTLIQTVWNMSMMKAPLFNRPLVTALLDNQF